METINKIKEIFSSQKAKIECSLILMGILLPTQAVLCTPCFALEIFNRSPAAVEYGFDLMETFDDIKNWTGSVRTGQGPATIMSPDFPKRLDGSNTPLNFYDYWVSTDPGAPFISDHRTHGGKIWDPKNTGVGKSLCMDISHRGDNGLGDGQNWGPSRLGSYFGSVDGVTGDRTHGYTEMYAFFMIYIPKNEYPTSIDPSTRIGTYTEGQPYVYGESWKFMTMGHGFLKPWVHADGPGSGHVPEYAYAKATYGWYPNVSHLFPHNGKPEILFGDTGDYLAYQTNPVAPCINESHGSQSPTYTNVAIPLGQWIGVEVRYKLNTPGNDDAVKEYWWYEADGTEHYIASDETFWFQATCMQDDRMNLFFIGGNNSAVWLWGDTMDPKYYVDDFIINGSRIGPTYFAKKLGSATLIDVKPKSTSGKYIN